MKAILIYFHVIIAEKRMMLKRAFVSDYARFKILYEHGGVYFDTDVEVLKSMDDIYTERCIYWS